MDRVEFLYLLKTKGYFKNVSISNNAEIDQVSQS